jgi:hypothetical protein
MTRVFLSAALVLSITSWTIAQSDSGPKPPAKPGAAQPGDPAGQRGPRRDRQRFSTPERRRESAIERMVDRATEMYDLDDAQKISVKQEFETLQAQRRTSMGPEADEFDQLRTKMTEIMDKARESSKGTPPDRETMRKMRDDPELKKIRERMRAIDEKYPFNWDDALKRIESLLPPEQAAKGRALREERDDSGRDARSPDRFPRFRREDSERRKRDRAGRNRNRTGNSSPDAAAGDKAAEIKPVAPRPLHPWEVYVHQFIAEHKLTDVQSNSAMAILKDMRQRAEQVEKHVADKPAATTQSSADEIKKRTDAIFEELKQRLDALLTAEQRTPAKKP